MDQSRRAVNSYWRSRMVDAVTSDEDKVAPVYKLEEICDLLRTAHVSIVKEMSEFVLKRLDHKSPIVKQKALRLIKYTVGKSGTEFRREMQRHSAVVKQLFHYKGHPDPFKGDALNKAVRDTAHEAVSAIFANEDNNSNNSSSNNKAVAPTEGFQKRIQGFGNTNYEMPSEEKKSFLSEVVGIGLSTIAAANSMRKGESGISGSYKSPNLRRSLNTDIGGGGERYEGGEYHSESSYASSGSSRNVASGTWGQELRTTMNNTAADEDTTLSHLGVKSREERLLETIVTSGGVRLQPTRDAIHVFLTEASKLDAVAMSRALEMKLQSHLWQVRMKACCVLEAILRKKEDGHFSIVASYFSENDDSLVKCSELPQVSLREKATKVLSLLEGDQSSRMGETGESSPMPVPAVEMPDLIDTGEPDDYGSESSMQKHVDPNSGNLASSGSIVDELFGDAPSAAGLNTNENINDDPFADVSFHVNEDKQDDNIFSGLAVDSSRFEHEQKRPSSNGSGMIDMFSSISDHPVQGIEGYTGSMNDLMAGLSLNGTVQDNKQPGTSFVNGISQSSQLPTNGGPNGGLGSSTLFPLAPMQYNMPANMIFNPTFPTQPMNYGAMGALIAEHQLLLQNLGNMNSGGYGHNTGNVMDGGYSSPLPDIFHLSNNHAQYHTAVLTTAKKEDTKAFDFISDHLSATRDSKRVL